MLTSHTTPSHRPTPIAEATVDEDGPNLLNFPDAQLFFSALCSGRAHSRSDLDRLTAAQLSLEAAAVGRTVALHEKHNPTLASACFYLRASAGAAVRSLGLDAAVPPALHLIERAISKHRASVGVHSGDEQLEPADTLAVSILYKLAQTHDFALQPTVNLRDFVRKNLTFAPALLPDQRRHREAGFVASALGMPRQPVVSSKAMLQVIRLDHSTHARSDESPDDIFSALDAEIAGEDWAIAVLESDSLLGNLATRFNLPAPALKSLRTPVMHADGRHGAVRAVAAAGAVLSPAALGSAKCRQAVEKGCAQAQEAAGSIFAALDEGADVSALPSLARAEHSLRLALHKLDLEPVTGFTLIDHTQTLQSIREKVYAVAPDELTFIQLTMVLLTWQLL